MIDSHCHLQVEALRSDAARWVADAKACGVSGILIPGIDFASSQSALALAEDLHLWCSAGTHPCHVADHALEGLRSLLLEPRVVAVGECGLDYFHTPFDPVLQERVFREQIGLAQDFDLPLILHNRNSDADLVKILRDYSGIRGVFHCFGGDRQCLEEALDLGFFVSFAGNVTYKNSPLRELAKLVPLDRLLVETDAPWLAPMPHRGKPNQPAWVVRTLQELSLLRDQPMELLESATVDNFYQCFPKARQTASREAA